MVKQSLDTKTIVDELKKRLAQADTSVSAKPVGTVLSIGDGVATVSGLTQVGYQELVTFENGVNGVALLLAEDYVGVVVLGDYLGIKEGDQVRATGRLLSIPVSDTVIGRVIDPLGNARDGKANITSKTYYPLEKLAPGVTVRKSVNRPVQTGIISIDGMVPIGRGQRQLIIGDRGTGKTAVTIDAITNQKGKNLICIYVAIGQKTSRIAQIVEQLRQRGAMDYTVIVTADASDPAALQYIAPYAGCAIAEYFMDQGKDALVVYDDLSKHAWAYRQISLILKRPSGREAYPGDVFFLHSRLLERACQLDEKHGGGSITALPIIETQAGDISAYIPTNVISITDGQIFLETDLFYAGIRPAINVGNSVSRVGGSAQIKAMKQVAGKLRIELAQYRALAAFVQFATDLDKATRDQIARGARLTEILKQPQYQPIPVGRQISIIWAVTNGYADDVEVTDMVRFKEELFTTMESSHGDLLASIEEKKALDDKLIEKLKKAVEDFKKTFSSEAKLKETNVEIKKVKAKGKK